MNSQRSDNKNQNKPKLLHNRHLKSPHHRDGEEEQEQIRDNVRYGLDNVDSAAIDAGAFNNRGIPCLVNRLAREYQSEDRGDAVANDDDGDDDTDDSKPAKLRHAIVEEQERKFGEAEAGYWK